MNPRLIACSAIALISFFLFGCMGSQAYRDGRNFAVDGKPDDALRMFQLAATEQPGNPEYRATYLKYRDQMIRQWQEQANLALRAGQDKDAEALFRKILEVDPDNARAKGALSDLSRNIKHKALLGEAENALKKQDYETAATRLRIVLSENPENPKAIELKTVLDEKTEDGNAAPQLSAALKKPITIEFKEAPIRQIFEVLSRTSGLNFVFDKDIRGDQRATIFLRNGSIHDALNLLLLTNQLEQRVLDSSSILIYPNTAGKTKDYQALTVKTFILSNLDAKTAANTIKTIVKTKDIVIDEKQNLLTMRDTPDAVRMAEKLMVLYDSPVPEVMLEVAILEVSRSSLIGLGVQWPSNLTLSPLPGPGGNLTLSDLKNLSSSTTEAKLPPMIVNANKTDGNVNVLANPRIRVKNLESAKIMIGERVPNITTTSTSTGFVSENIQYVDVGLKLEALPTIYADNEVAIKISLEVSNIVDKVRTTTGGLAYQIGTRNASTLLRLHDGENQVLAGLIKDEERSTGNRVPGLGDIPLLGRLFGTQTDESLKSEIVLSITPRIVRNTRRPSFGYTEFDSGTETALRMRPEGALPGKLGENANRRVAASTSVAVPTTAAVVNGTQPPNPPAVATTPVESSTSADTVPSATRFVLQGPPQVKTGGAFTLQLAIQPGESITSIPLALSYNPKVLEVTGVAEGDFLKQGNGTTSFSNRVDKNGGQIFATLIRNGQTGASSPGGVFSVSFKAIGPASESSVQVTAVAPIGLQGRTINATPPPPFVFSVAP